MGSGTKDGACHNVLLYFLLSSVLISFGDQAVVTAREQDTEIITLTSPQSYYLGLSDNIPLLHVFHCEDMKNSNFFILKN